MHHHSFQMIMKIEKPENHFRPMEIILFAAFLLISSTCNCQTNIDVKCSRDDRNALLDFKNGLKDPENTLSSWRGVDCCSRWRGISCSNITNGVTVIDLHRYGLGDLNGGISPSLIQLKSLTHLDLSSNTFGGIPIPDFFGSFKNLRYLNLSNAGFSGIIPPSIGNLSNLQVFDVSNPGFPGLAVDDLRWITNLVSLSHLNMNGVDLSLVNTNWLQMLNMLSDLTELHLSACGLSGSVSSLSSVNFTSLAVIDLSFNSFSSMFPNWLVNITTLVHVDLRECTLRGRIPLGFGELPSLRFFNLALNGNLSASVVSLFKGRWRKIEVIDLASNKVHGKIPRSIGNMASLMDLNLFDNDVDGGVPSTIGSLCKLVNLDVSTNKMVGNLPERLEGTEKCGAHNPPLPSLMKLRLDNNQLHGRLPDWLGQVINLEELSLDFNFFEGPLPASLGSLQNLTDLTLAGNRLNGTLPENIGQLSKLVVFDVSFNSLTGILSEVHFHNMRKLKILRLSSNSFTLNVSSSWVPRFQIRNLDIGSCRLGPSFPEWLESQNEIMFLDISNTSISGSIPSWFWDLSFNLSLLNVSFNRLQGQLPSSFEVTPYADVDLSSNLFVGPVPVPSVPVELLDLSNNRFQGPIPHNISNELIFLSLSGNELTGEIPLGIGNISLLSVLDFSRNHLTGTIPSSLGQCTYLKVLDLGNNRLYGEIPSSIGLLNMLQSLHLNDNFFSGNLPSSFKNLSSLETLDLGTNNLEGNVPLWLGEGFAGLRILNLRSNAFSGEILFGFSNLTSLQVLDLGGNSLRGRIPTTLGDLKAMQQERIVNEYLLYARYRGMYYEENLVVNLKNQFQKFTKTLALVTALDISGNNLSGEFPDELTNLKGLMFLNLSRNHITGQIPGNISRLRHLSSLDLSSNDLSGPIPNSMASLSFMGYLNLSNNNLSGEIPSGGQMSTFGENAFEGNSGLCGAPLVVECPGEKPGTGENPRNGNGNIYVGNEGWFYLSIGLGFATGILVPCLVLMIRKPWSEKYFEVLDNVVRKLLSCVVRKKEQDRENEVMETTSH